MLSVQEIILFDSKKEADKYAKLHVEKTNIIMDQEYKKYNGLVEYQIIKVKCTYGELLMRIDL